MARLFDLFRTTRQALDLYRPAPYPGRLTLLLASSRPAAAGQVDPAEAWADLAGAGSELELLPGDHYSIVRPPAVAALAGALRRRLAAAKGRPRRAPISHAGSSRGATNQTVSKAGESAGAGPGAS